MPDVLSTADTTAGAGVFNRRITIQQPGGPGDGQGGQTTPITWTTILSTWAHIEPWKGNEAFTAGQVYPNKYVTIMLRYRPSLNITPIMRVLYRNQIYNIRSVTVPAEAQTTMKLSCEELQAKGST